MPRLSPTRSLWLFAAALVSLCAVAGVGALYVAGFVPLRAPSAGHYPVRGIDLSHHQGEVDWDAIPRDAVHFVFIKATEGRDHRDPRFAENWAAAGRVGIPRGAYHFFTFCTPGPDQAAHFLEVVPPGAGELPPVVDVEFTGNCTAWEDLDRVRDDLVVFVDQIRRAHGREPILYLNRPSYHRIVRGHFETSPLWVRDLFFRPSVSEYGPWRFWQYDDDGRVAGIRGPVDLNVFEGGPQRFAELLR